MMVMMVMIKMPLKRKQQLPTKHQVLHRNGGVPKSRTGCEEGLFWGKVRADQKNKVNRDGSEKKQKQTNANDSPLLPPPFFLRQVLRQTSPSGLDLGGGCRVRMCKTLLLKMSYIRTRIKNNSQTNALVGERNR